jgi:hypothetical protein
VLEDYFSLQLAFSKQYASKARVTLSGAVDRCTNLRRRLGLTGSAGESHWRNLLACVDRSALVDDDAVLTMCSALYAERPPASLERAFGCFSYDPPGASGILRLHFVPPENVAASPLAKANVEARTNELRAMFEHVRREESHATDVMGISWLYNIEAYKRLFPARYVESARRPEFPLHLNGSSSWGQVLNWRQAVKPAMRGALLARLSDLRVEAPWEIFPYRALVARCEMGVFYDHFT